MSSRPASSVLSDDSGDENADEKSPKIPLVFENPDGSLHHALPSGTRYKRPAPETPPHERLGRDWVFWDPELMRQIEIIYAKHEKAFIMFLFLQFLLENSFNALLIKHREGTLKEIARAYPFITDEHVGIMFWLTVGIATVFAAFYYVVACFAVYERRSMYMRVFSDLAMIGILGQVMFAYINRFNLILFFLRFIVFSYSRFLLSILNGTARIIFTRRVAATENTQEQEVTEETIVIEV